MRSNSSRPGMTMFSLLLVLGVMGMLAAIFFPALLKVREAAKRMRCSSNMRQLGIALHNYHAVYAKFPGIGNGKNSSWCYEILPYLEVDPTKEDVSKKPLPLFYSPGRRKAELYGDLPKIDYAGCTGNCDDPGKPLKEKGRGVFDEKGTTLDAIVNGDGTSNTMMLGPKLLRITDYTTGKGKGDDGSCWTGGTADTLRSSNEDKRPPRRDDPKFEDERGFGSPFEGTMPVVMADGAIRPISYAAKGKAFRELCNWDGGVLPDDKDLE